MIFSKSFIALSKFIFGINIVLGAFLFLKLIFERTQDNSRY